MDDLFPEIPQDLTQLDDAELAALAASLRDRVREIHAGRRDPEVVGDRTQTQVAEEMQAAVLGIEQIDAEIASRAQSDEEYDTGMDELARRAGVETTMSAEEDPDPDPDPAPDDDDGDQPPADGGEGTGDGEGQTAAAATASNSTGGDTRYYRGVRPLPAARRHRPVDPSADDGRGLRVTSHAAGLGGMYDAMHQMDREELGIFLTDVVRRNRVQPGQKAVLAHASIPFPRERILEDGPDGYHVNSQRIRDITGHQALVASGGLCAPLPPIYDLPGIETASRPVRGALPSFQAARGGVQVGLTPKMGTYTEAVGVVTADENEAGGTLAVKSCMRIECPAFSPTTVDSIYQCIEADNLAARAYPELMSRIGDLVMAEQARLADSKLLTAIKAGSTAVTYGDVTPGAVFQFLGAIYAAAAGVRSRNRTIEGARLQALIPAWVIDLLAVDHGRQANQDSRPQTRAAIETWLGNAGITPVFYLDGPSTGTGQVFGAQTAGALLPFPEFAQIALYPAGTWLHLDAGELQLGVVRDSTLNSTNDFQIFSETWENVVFVGVESLWLTLEVCPSGASAAAADVSDYCGT